MVLSAVNETRGIPLASRVTAADSIGKRCLGLLGRPRLSEGEGLWLSPCGAVHTFFMRFPIDVVFLDEEGRVVALRTLVPWRFSAWVRKAESALELPAGTAERTGTRVGDRIQVSKPSRKKSFWRFFR